MTHHFGGLWTRKKLEMLEQYLRFYTQALKNQAFTLHYVDAFAGTGSHVPVVEDSQPMLVPYEDFKGSVLTALEVNPGFHRYHFNDLNPDHINELEKIRQDYPTRQIQIYQQDANLFVPEFCGSLGKNDRAVLFLDPYSTQLNWETLEHVAKSEKTDLWLLFPISAILRMTPKQEERLIPEWKGALNKLLGTADWETALYKPVERPPIEDMFGHPENELPGQRMNVKELESWVTSRLRSLFQYVAEPVPLRNKGRPLFLFYFAVSNPKEAAWRLADRAATHIIKQNIGRD